jgi:hypothetical protein
MNLTPDEIKAVRRAVNGSIDLYKGYVNIPYVEDNKMKRKKVRLSKALVDLRSALKKLK